MPQVDTQTAAAESGSEEMRPPTVAPSARAPEGSPAEATHVERCYGMVQVGAESERSEGASELVLVGVESECLSGPLALDPNERYLKGVSLLHVAAYFGGERMTKLILDHGGDPGAKAETGLTAHDFAVQQGHERVASLLEGGKIDWRQWRSIRELIAEGATPPLVTSNTFLTTWAGEVTEFRTSDGKPPHDDGENLEWKITITWSGDQSPHRCHSEIIKRSSEVKDATMRSLSMTKCTQK